jgi:1-acyl-sn-glycerol-3-phosphate acyltransferase
MVMFSISSLRMRVRAADAILRILLLLSTLLVLPLCTLLVLGASAFGPRARYDLVMALTPWFCRWILLGFGVRLKLDGRRSREAHVFVSNHLSYLDIFIAGAAIGGVFVSRHDLKDWPGIGWFAQLAGTVFIDRSSLRSAITSSEGIVFRVRQGARITLFPEGRIPEDGQIADFKPFLLGAVAQEGLTVQPFTIVYTHLGREPVTAANHHLVYWNDPTVPLPRHAWRLMKLPFIRARVVFGQPAMPAGADKRAVREFTEQLRDAVAQGKR